MRTTGHRWWSYCAAFQVFVVTIRHLGTSILATPFPAISLFFSGTKLIQTTNANRLEDFVVSLWFQIEIFRSSFDLFGMDNPHSYWINKRNDEVHPSRYVSLVEQTRTLIDIHLNLLSMELLYEAKFYLTTSSIPFEQSNLCCESFTITDEESSRTRSMSIGSDAD